MSNRKKTKKKQQRPPQAELAVVDFDAITAKRRRATRQLPPIKIGGKDYRLPPTLPLAVTDAFAEHARLEENGQGERNTIVLIDDMKRLLADMFGAEQWQEISRHIDLADVPVLFARVFQMYGENVGESSRSGQS